MSLWHDALVGQTVAAMEGRRMNVGFLAEAAMHSLDEWHTARLRLYRPREQDFEDYVRMYSDPVVMATLAGVRTRHETRGYFDRLLAQWDQHGFGLWIMRDPRTGEFIGRGGLRALTLEGRDEVEVGYALMASHWGRGLATELARESVRVGFAVLDRTDLVSFTLPTNRASQHVMEKAGFVYERDGLHADLPHVFYRLTAERWRSLAAEGQPL
jgi:RimJ/RimL family protein N-acetyltransferase